MINLSRLLLLALVGASLLTGGCSGSGPGIVQNNTATPPPNPTNSPPTISGSPPAAAAIGQPYSFTPTASDPDGDSLTFSIQNRPAWASFDASNGQIAGTPAGADVGVYSNISISVSDGAASVSIPQFAVSVDQLGTASATLSWTPPNQNSDGSTLTDLAGFVIYYGQASGNLPNEIRIDNPGITTYVVDGLTPSTYYFAATAFNSSNVESARSGEAVKTLN